MANKPKIPPALHALVMQLAGENRTHEEIAAALWRDHRCETTARSVGRLLERFAEERRIATQAVLRELLGPIIGSSVRMLADALRRADKISRQARKTANALRSMPEGDPQITVEIMKAAVMYDKVALAAIDKLCRSVNIAFHYSGQNQPDKPGTAKVDSVTDARQALLKRVQDLVEKVGAKEPKTDPSVH